MNTNDKSFSRIKLLKKEKKQAPERYPEPPIQPGYSFGSFLSDMGNQQVQNLFEAGLVQAKLSVSQPNDAYELEADRIANTIVAGGSIAGSGIVKTSSVRRKGGIPSDALSESAGSKIVNLEGKGKPLDKTLKAYFEPRFGVDLGNVRIHNDSEANRLSRSIHAKAFTHGEDIVFGQGEYRPESTEGRKLIAHELTHVVQQQDSEPDLTVKRDILQDIFSSFLKGEAWFVEHMPLPKMPVPGAGFMQEFLKGIMVGALLKLSDQKVEKLWTIYMNVMKATTSFEYMKEFFWGFLRGFFSDFILIYELPGTIQKTIEFVNQLVKDLKSLTPEDRKAISARIGEIKTEMLDCGMDFVKDLQKNIKDRNFTPIIELLGELGHFSFEMGKGIGGNITDVMLKYFSKDSVVLGKELGSTMGELSGTVVFQALIILITEGVGSVWTAARTAIKEIKTVIGKVVAKVAEAIGKVLRYIGKAFGRIIEGIKGLVKSFGKSKLLTGIKDKLASVLGKVKGLVDDIVERIMRIKLFNLKITGYKPQRAVEILEDEYELVYDAATKSWKKADIQISFKKDKWVYKKGSKEVGEWQVKPTHKTKVSTSLGENSSFFQSHHGIQNDWGKKRLGKFGYNEDEVPTILLRDSFKDTPHQAITAQQNARKSLIEDWDYFTQRSATRRELKEVGVPDAIVNDYLSQADGYFKKIYDNMTKLGKIKERDKIFGAFKF